MVSPGALLATNASSLMTYINDGDRIAIDILNHKIELLGSKEEITARKAACAPSHPGRSPAISSANAPW